MQLYFTEPLQMATCSRVKVAGRRPRNVVSIFLLFLARAEGSCASTELRNSGV